MLSKLPRWIWIGIWVLAFVAGAVNVVGFLCFSHQSVTHLTGTTSMLGASLGTADMRAAARYLSVLASFVFGAFVSGYTVRDGALQLGRHYGIIMIAEAGLLYLSPHLLARANIWGIYVASCACGLQNGMVTNYSGAVVRTTHVSGMFTDLGLFLGNAVRGQPYDRRRLQMCCLVISGFLLGGVAGSWLFGPLGVFALYVPATVVLLAGFVYFSYARSIPS
ncbi:MAG TPA: YoaK family protein [Opitutaceae bacterium]